MFLENWNHSLALVVPSGTTLEFIFANEEAPQLLFLGVVPIQDYSPKLRDAILDYTIPGIICQSLPVWPSLDSVSYT